jgi:hypothetical protein
MGMSTSPRADVNLIIPSCGVSDRVYSPLHLADETHVPALASSGREWMVRVVPFFTDVVTVCGMHTQFGSLLDF